MEHDATPRHRIGAVARLTGITTHALRVWERRYGGLKPTRTDGGDRLYSDDDVHRLRLMKRLSSLGHTIGDIATLPLVELERLRALHNEPTIESDSPDSIVERYLAHIERLELASAERVLTGAALTLSRRELIGKVLSPLLHEIGTRWQNGSLQIAEEHAATSMIRNQLGTMLRLFAPEPSAPIALATTLEGELHELGALMATVVAAMSGWHGLYLGCNMPVAEIAHAVRSTNADATLVSCVALPPKRVSVLVGELSHALPPSSVLLVGGPGAPRERDLPRGVLRMGDVNEFESWLSVRTNPTSSRAAERAR